MNEEDYLPIINEFEWVDHRGHRTKISKMSNMHLLNVFKYCTSSNCLPPYGILMELTKRKLLRRISDQLKPMRGYKSPEEIRKEPHIEPS